MSSGILHKIVSEKKKRLEARKKDFPLGAMIKALKEASSRQPLATGYSPVANFVNAIAVPNQVSIIAEMKKRSPSAGLLVKSYSPGTIAKMYEKAGARALSVLTEEDYFNGRAEHISEIKKASALPILRKDFIFDPYQIYESKILGASAILLILAILNRRTYVELLKLAKELGMTALVEVHTEKELEMALREKPDLIGINNRDLKTLKVNIETSFRLAERVPNGITIVAESGIKSPKIIHELKNAGISAALIGESILKSRNKLKILKSYVEAGMR